MPQRGSSLDPQVLVLGANGQLGRALRDVLPHAHFMAREDCDLADLHAVQNLDLRNVKVLVNAAAYTAVDNAETEEGQLLAQKINVDALEIIVAKLSFSGGTLVHLSSDYVFDGTKTTAYTETDQVSPKSVYGRTKAVGEGIALSMQKSYVIRTSWVVGYGENFVSTMLAIAKTEIKPKVVCDQFGRLTFANDLATAIRCILQKNAPYGIYNYTNSGEKTHWASIAQEIFRLSGEEPLRVIPVTSSEYFAGKKLYAPRPANSELDTTKISEFVPDIQDWQTRLVEFIRKESTSV